jgi:hypothetical protein
MRIRYPHRGHPAAGALLLLPLWAAACEQAPPEPGEAGPGAKPAAPSKAEAAVAARPVALDAATREASARALGASIGRHVDRSPGAAKVTEVAGGGRHADMGEGYQSVVISRVNADGSRSTACVDDAREAEAFWRTGEAPAGRGGER